MDSENGNKSFGDIDFHFPRLWSFGEISNSARRGFGGMRAFIIYFAINICYHENMNFEQKDFSLEFSKENALKLIEEGKAIEVVNNINKYKDLDDDVAEGLFNEKNGINTLILSGCLS